MAIYGSFLYGAELYGSGVSTKTTVLEVNAATDDGLTIYDSVEFSGNLTAAETWQTLDPTGTIGVGDFFVQLKITADADVIVKVQPHGGGTTADSADAVGGCNQCAITSTQAGILEIFTDAAGLLDIAASNNTANVDIEVIFAICVANVAPVVTGTAPVGVAVDPADPITFTTTDDTQVTEATIDCALTDPALAVVDAIINGVFQAGYNGTIVANGSNGFDVTISTHPPMAAGVWSAYAYAEDGVAASGNDTWGWTVVNAAPVVTGTAPVGVAVDPADWIVFTTTDDDQVTEATIDCALTDPALAVHHAVINGAFQPGYSGTIVANATNGFDVTISTHPFMAAGVWSAYAYCEDIYGISGNDTWGWTVVNAAPVVTGLLPVGVMVVPIATVTFTTTDDDNVDSATISLDLTDPALAVTNAIINGIFQPGYTGTIVANATNGFDVTLLTHPSMAVGVWSATADCDDIYGVSGTDTWGWTVVTPPVLTGTAPLVSTANQSAPITFTTTDDIQVIQISIDCKLTDPALAVTDAIINGVFQAGFNGTIVANASNGFDVAITTLPAPMAFGSWSAWAYCEDAATASGADIWAWVVDAPPVISNNLPTGANEDGAVDISFDCSDDVQVIQALIDVDFVDPLFVVTAVIVNGVFQPGYSGTIVANAVNGFAVTINAHPLFAPGAWQVDAYVTDGAASTTSLSWGFTVGAMVVSTADSRQSTLTTIDIVFDREPQHLDPMADHDGTNLANYVLTGPVAPFVERRLLVVTYIGDNTLRVWFDGPLVRGEQYQLDLSNIASVNPMIIAPTSITIVAFGAGADTIPLERISANRWDIRNPQTPRDSDGKELGTFVYSDTGDLDVETRRQYLRKRIYRRLSTPKGSMMHLPNYGLKIADKTLIRATQLRQLQNDIESQISEEPDVISVRAVVSTPLPGMTVIKLKVGDAFGSFALEHAYGEE